MKIKKRKKYLKNESEAVLKSIALFSIYLMISLTFLSAHSFALNPEEKSEESKENVFIKILNWLIPGANAAEVENCCAVDKTGRNFCSEEVSEADCYIWRAGRSCDEVDECREGVCVPLENGKCLDGIEKIKCEYENAGRWYAAEKDTVTDCQVGCCVTPNKAQCFQEEKAACERQGYLWDSSSEQECKLKCAAVEYGCCDESGVFTNKHREACEGKFYGHAIYCSQVIGSGVRKCEDIRPGDGSTDKDMFDCYCYDSTGKREGIAPSPKVEHVTAEGEITEGSGDCSATEICKDEDGEMGEAAQCKSTNCIDNCASCDFPSLKSGESLCANVLPGHFNPGARSSGLKNFIIRCQNGEIKADDSYDPDASREKICVETEEESFMTTKAVKNNWEGCQGCGESGVDILDVLGYVPVVGPGIGRIFGGDVCRSDTPFDALLTSGGEICSERGMCESYDHDFWAPIGSCNPLHPPGREDKCASCGEGGDSLTNVCTEEECEHLGNCQFESDPIGTSGMYTAFMTAMGVCGIAYVYASRVAFTCRQAKIPLINKECAKKAYTSAAEFCAKFISKNPNMLYWGVYTLAFGFFAAPNAAVREQTTEMVYGKVKMKDAIIAYKGLNERGAYENWLLSEATLIAVTGDILVGGVIPGQLFASKPVVQAMLGKDLISTELESQIGGYIEAERARAALEAAGKDTLAALAETTRASGLVDTTAKKYGLEPILDTQIKRRAAIDAGAKATAKDAAAKASGKVAAEQTSKWITFLNIVGVLVNLYFAGRAMNTGKCSAESAYTPDEKAELQEEGYDVKCENCGWLEGQPWCTEQRCAMLGTDCVWAQDPDSAKADGKCYTKDLDDVTQPALTALEAEYFDHDKNKLGEDSGIPKVERTAELPYNMTYIKIYATTNEAAKCSWSLTESQEHKSMTTFADEALYPTEHETNYIAIDRNILPAEFTYYIKCKDVAGNAPPAAEDKNYVKFKVEGGPDVTPPVIEYIDPKGFMPLGTETINLKVLAFDSNAVKSCEYATDGTFYSMSRVGSMGSAKCATSIAERCDYFEADNVELNCTEFEALDPEAIGLTGEQKRAFLEQQAEYKGTNVCPLRIKCTDTKDNSEEANYSIVITPLFNVTIISPEDGYDRTPEIKIETSRPSVCSYTLLGKEYTFDSMLFGTEEHVIEHNETLSPRDHPYRLTVECRDIAGTKIRKEKDFRVMLDYAEPIIVRAYRDGMLLHVVTNEDAICVFSTESCNYDFEIGTGMPEGRFLLERDHETIWREEVTYYVKCTDEWENYPGQSPTANACTANGIIKAYEVPVI